jgi:hypothetical protein
MENNVGSQVAGANPAGAGGGPGNGTPASVGRAVFLNALPLNALSRRHVRLDVQPVDINELVRWTRQRLEEGYGVVHFIRHIATLQVLRDAGIPLPETPVVSLYSYEPGDVIVVITLRNPPRGQEVVQVRPEDLDIWVINVL